MDFFNYDITLDAFKSGVQRVIQGFQTGEANSRTITISLRYGTKPFELPLDNVQANMYVRTPSATTPSINPCTIDGENNTIIYEIQDTDIEESGITRMQLKIFDSHRVIVSPSFGIETWESAIEDSQAETSPNYTALDEALTLAQTYSNKTLYGISIDADTLIITFTYKDGTTYVSDALQIAAQKYQDYSLESEAWAKGTKDGVPVTSSAPQYNNHSLYHSQISQAYANSSLAFANESNQHAQESNGYAQESRGYRNESFGYADESKGYRNESSGYANESKGYRNQSQGYATESQGWVKEAEAWAKGTKNGSPVSSSDPTYNNHSKHWAEQAELLAERAEDAVDDCNDILAEIEKDIGNANFWVDDATGDLMYDNDSAYVFWVDEATGDLMMEVQV